MSRVCVIVSYYDERPIDHLVSLLRQLLAIDYAGEAAIRVVINSDNGKPVNLPTDLQHVALEYRQNSGFNIGAWDHGWRANSGYPIYVFLQDECAIVDPRWLQAYTRILSRSGVGLVGESLFLWKDWQTFNKSWPEAVQECKALSAECPVWLGKSPTHLQTLALAATDECLRATNGFLQSDKKIAAIATEILLSRRCIERGFSIAQSAWRPFKYISHPQWQTIRSDSKNVRWHLSRLFHLIYARLPSNNS